MGKGNLTFSLVYEPYTQLYTCLTSIHPVLCLVFSIP